MHGYDLYADIDVASAVEEGVFDMQIILNGKVFSELDFNGNAVFDKINLIVCVKRSKTSIRNSLLLL